MNSSRKQKKTLHLSNLICHELPGLSPIQTIMKMAEEKSMYAMGLQPEKVISFGGGWCNHTAPVALRDAYQRVLKDPRLFHQSGRYSPIIGDTACREQLCRFEKTIYRLSPLESENILLGQSSTQLFHDVLRVICDPGEPIAFLDPTYANYLNAVTCALASSPKWFVPALAPDTWQYLADYETSLERLSSYCKKGLRVFIVPVPDNPTSQIPPDEFLKGALDILEDVKGYLILDYAYKALWFGDMPPCYTWSPRKHPHLITLHSNSKWLSSLGRRLGWVEADEAVIKGLEKINESMLLSPDTLHSMTTAFFLEETIADGSLKRYVDDTRLLYEKTASVMMSAIDTSLGWSRLTPDGGLYTCCPTPHHETPQGFVERLLKTTGVLLIPGTGFGPSMEYGLRFSYGPLCYQHDRIIEGIDRISRYLAQPP